MKLKNISVFCCRSVKLTKERLGWVGHVLRSEDLVLHEVLHFVPDGGACGHPRRSYYDTIKKGILNRSITIVSRDQTQFWNELSVTAADRNAEIVVRLHI